jgi:hypothetical protein
MRLNLACALVLFVGSSFTLACGGDDDDEGTPDAAADDGDDVGDDDGTPDAGVDCSTQMFDKYGLDAFVAVNDAIIAASVAAPTAMVGTSFQDLAAAGDERVQEFTTNLANFLVLVYGGPDNYTGPSMVEAHTGLDITEDQYTYFVTQIIVPVLTDAGVSSDDITNCFAPPVLDPDFKATIIGL